MFPTLSGAILSFTNSIEPHTPITYYNTYLQQPITERPIFELPLTYKLNWTNSVCTIGYKYSIIENSDIIITKQELLTSLLEISNKYFLNNTNNVLDPKIKNILERDIWELV